MFLRQCEWAGSRDLCPAWQKIRRFRTILKVWWRQRAARALGPPLPTVYDRRPLPRGERWGLRLRAPARKRDPARQKIRRFRRIFQVSCRLRAARAIGLPLPTVCERRPLPPGERWKLLRQARATGGLDRAWTFVKAQVEGQRLGEDQKTRRFRVIPQFSQASVPNSCGRPRDLVLWQFGRIECRRGEGTAGGRAPVVPRRAVARRRRGVIRSRIRGGRTRLAAFLDSDYR